MHALIIKPLLASGALQFAFEKATTEGKVTIGVLIIVSLFSWTVIITKFRQLYRARKMGTRFFASYRSTGRRLTSSITRPPKRSNTI